MFRHFHRLFLCGFKSNIQFVFASWCTQCGNRSGVCTCWFHAFLFLPSSMAFAQCLKTQQIKLFILIQVVISTFLRSLRNLTEPTFITTSSVFGLFEPSASLDPRCYHHHFLLLYCFTFLFFLLPTFALCHPSIQTCASRQKRCGEATVNVAARVRIIMLNI